MLLLYGRLNLRHIIGRAGYKAKTPKPQLYEEKILVPTHTEPHVNYIKEFVIPSPRDNLTVEMFLKSIGRDAISVLDKVGTWAEMFTANEKQWLDRGITVQMCKYIKYWCHKYSLGFDPYPLRDTKAIRRAKAGIGVNTKGKSR